MQHLKANYLEAPSELSRPRNCLFYLVPKHLLNANCPGNSRYRFLPSPWQTAVCFLFLVIRPLVMGSLSVWSDHHTPCLTSFTYGSSVVQQVSPLPDIYWGVADWLLPLSAVNSGWKCVCTGV